MFDKKNARSTSVTRNDSSDFGFNNSRGEVSNKMFWDETIPGKTDQEKVDSRQEDMSIYPAITTATTSHHKQGLSNTRMAGIGRDISRPASSLGMTSFHSPLQSPAGKYARQRRGSVSGYDNNEFGSKFTSCGSYWRSKSIDMSAAGFTEYPRRSPSIKLSHYKSDTKDNTKRLYRDEPSNISSNIWSRTYQMQNNIPLESSATPFRGRKRLTRTEAFDSVTQFSDAIDSQYKSSNGYHGCDEENLVSPPKSRLRHKTLAYGVSKDDLNCAKSVMKYNQGSNEDMKKVLLELDNTGYFSEVWPK